MCDKFRAHHIICTSLYEGKGYSGAFCENMTAVVERLRENPDEKLLLVAEPDIICSNCPNRTKENGCAHNNNRVVEKDRRVLAWTELEEEGVYTYREMCSHARAHITREIYQENCGECDWLKQGLCKYEDLIDMLDRTVEGKR